MHGYVEEIQLKQLINPLIASILEPFAPKAPETAERAHLRSLRQIHAMNLDTLRAAESVEYQAKIAKCAALKASKDTQVQLELLEERLGLRDQDGIIEEGESGL